MLNDNKTSLPDVPVSPVNFEEFMKKSLKDSGIVKHVVMGDALDDITMSTIKHLLTEPRRIEYNRNGLLYKNLDGDDVQCPNFGFNISADGKWLSDKIPSITFDVDQNGNIRKAEEAQAAYCCAIVILVLNDDSFLNEFNDTLKGYDFTKMIPKDGCMTFSVLLESWQNYQSTIINVCVSAAKYKISDLKKDSEKFLKDSIPEDQCAELRNLSDLVKSINRQYSTGVLSPENVKQLKKKEVLEQIDLRSAAINDAVDRSSVGTLYKITGLSTEYLDPLIKKKIDTLAEIKVNELFKHDPNLIVILGDRRELVIKWKRRYAKLARLSKRKVEIELLTSDPVNYTLPSKL